MIPPSMDEVMGCYIFVSYYPYFWPILSLCSDNISSDLCCDLLPKYSIFFFRKLGEKMREILFKQLLRQCVLLQRKNGETSTTSNLCVCQYPLV